MCVCVGGGGLTSDSEWGGGCRKHLFSVTPYNFQKSAGGGVEASPPAPPYPRALSRTIKALLNGTICPTLQLVFHNIFYKPLQGEI